MIYLSFLVLGIGNGAIFASLALILLVGYRSSGVINFGVGSMALYGGYVFAFLRQGKYLIPIPGLPATVSIGAPLSVVPALLITAVTTALAGSLLELLIFRHLRSRPPMTSVIASVGVLLLIPALIAVQIGTNPVSTDPIFPTANFTAGGLSVPADRVWLAVTIVVIAVAIAVLYRRTIFGLATRAVADSTIGASASGIRTSGVALVNWALAGAVAGLAGAFLAPLVPLAPDSYAYLTIPALAALLAARFRTIPVAVALGFVMGMFESELTYLPARFSWLPQQGLSDLVPLVVIVIVLLATSDFALQQRAVLADAGSRFGRMRHPVMLSVAVFAGGALMVTVGSGTFALAVITSCGMAIVGLSYVVITGMAGQVSLAQLTLAGVGAYAVSQLSTAGVPFPLSPLLACLAAAALSVLIGLPALRLRGIGVAVATLALATAVESVWFNNPSLSGGASGVSPVRPRLFGIDLSPGSGLGYPRPIFGLGCVLALGVAVYCTARLRGSRLGLALLAVKANQKSAAASGINVARVKLGAFAVSGFLAGMGGVTLAYLWTNVSSGEFTAYSALPVLAAAYIAGVTSVFGGVLAGMFCTGGLLYVYLGNAVGVGNWFQLVGGIGLIVAMIREPDGMVGGLSRLQSYWHSRRGGAADLLGSASLPASASVPAQGQRPAEVASSRFDSLGGDLADTDAILRVRQVSVSYGGLTALDRVDLTVPRGAIVGLIGPNGAGKTTLVDAITSFVHADGSVTYNGREVSGSRAHELARQGLMRTFQGVELWHDLTVRENVEVGTAALSARDRGAGGDPVDDALAVMELTGLEDRLVGELSHGQRQRVSIARSLSAKPDLLVLDEPAAGLDSVESAELRDRFQEVRARGVTLLLIDHDMELMMAVCDLIYVLDVGRVVSYGTPDVVRRDPAVAAAYFGAGHEPTEPEPVERTAS